MKLYLFATLYSNSNARDIIDLKKPKRKTLRPKQLSLK